MQCPVILSLKKTVEVGYFLTNSVVFLFLAGQHLLCPNSFWCRDWTKADDCSRLKISKGNLICFHKHPHNINKFLGWHYKIPLSTQKGATLSCLKINPKQSTKASGGHFYHEKAINAKFQGFLCHFYLFLDFILFPVDLTMWRMYEI